VTVQATRQGERAQRRGHLLDTRPTASSATRALRTRNGNDITAIAATTAFHVKTTSMLRE